MAQNSLEENSSYAICIAGCLERSRLIFHYFIHLHQLISGDQYLKVLALFHRAIGDCISKPLDTSIVKRQLLRSTTSMQDQVTHDESSFSVGEVAAQALHDVIKAGPLLGLPGHAFQSQLLQLARCVLWKLQALPLNGDMEDDLHL